MDVRAPLVGRLYADATAFSKPQPGGGQPGQDAAAFVKSLTEGASETLRGVRGAEETVKAGLAGKADAQSVVQALAQTELAVETATTLRDKVVEAYNEILRMPV